MVLGGSWPAARSLSQKLPEIFQRATSNKRQAASRKRQAKRFDKKRFMYYIGYKTWRVATETRRGPKFCS